MTARTEAVLADVFAKLLPHLDEQQKRLTAGAAARVLGHGGIRTIARAARIAERTVARGADELDTVPEPDGRTPSPGAGRKPL